MTRMEKKRTARADGIVGVRLDDQLLRVGENPPLSSSARGDGGWKAKDGTRGEMRRQTFHSDLFWPGFLALLQAGYARWLGSPVPACTTSPPPFLGPWLRRRATELAQLQPRPSMTP